MEKIWQRMVKQVSVANNEPTEKLEVKYSLESTDPHESEIRAHLRL